MRTTKRCDVITLRHPLSLFCSLTRFRFTYIRSDHEEDRRRDAGPEQRATALPPLQVEVLQLPTVSVDALHPPFTRLLACRRRRVRSKIERDRCLCMGLRVTVSL